MSSSQKLSQLRPLMTRTDIEALLGVEETKQALDPFSGYQRRHGIDLSYSRDEDAIDYILFYSNFPHGAPVCDLSIGMSFEDIQSAWQEAGGKIKPSGFARFSPSRHSTNFEIEVAVQDGAVGLISLRRSNLEAVRTERERVRDARLAEQMHSWEEIHWEPSLSPDQLLLRSASLRSTAHLEFAQWLVKTTNPDIWHKVATRWNWDNDEAPLWWIIRQKNCDKATALEIFLLGSPANYLEYLDDISRIPEDAIDVFSLLSTILWHFVDGFYTRSELAFDPENAYGRIPASQTWSETVADSFFPHQITQKIIGRTILEIDEADDAICNDFLNKFS